MTPAGMLRVGRRHLRIVVGVYVILAGIALAVPAALANPRGESPHLSQEPSGR